MTDMQNPKGTKDINVEEKIQANRIIKIITEVFEKYGKSVRNELVKYLKEGPVIAFVLEGVDAINVTRKITGGTYPNESLPGTIRGDFAHISKNYANSKDILVRNLIHASGNKEDAEIEVPLWFNQKELHSYKTVHDLICLC